MSLIRKGLFSLAINLLCSLIYAIAIVFFIEPSGLIMGGATGVGLFLNHEFGLSLSGIVLIINIVMLLVGLIFLGRDFAMQTMICTFSIPVMIGIVTRFQAGRIITDDITLCTLFGGALIGVSLGIIMRFGSSTGGLDIPPLMMNKYCGFSVSASMWFVDVIVLLMQATASSGEEILYGIVLVVVYSIILDKTLIAGKSRVQILVVSKKKDEIQQFIIERIERGVTLLEGETGYLSEPCQLVMSVMSSRELPKVQAAIKAIDPEAFIIISKVTEVHGEGFIESGK